MASSDRRAIVTASAPTPTGPFSQAIVVDRLVFTAGQAGRNRDTGTMGDLREQVGWALANLDAILSAAGSGLEHAVKATVFLREGVDTAPLNEVWQERFAEPRPARSSVFVASLKNPEMLVEIELVAVIP